MCQHVHVDHRKNGQTKDLVEWLQNSNPVRNYWFYKSIGLKALIGSKGIELENGRKTICHMREALSQWKESSNELGSRLAAISETGERAAADSEEEKKAKDAAIRAILGKSFLPHRKGKAREHCSLGHRLEVPILNSWLNMIDEGDYFSEIEVKGAFTAGLAAKKNAVFAKDSVDFVLTVRDLGDAVKGWGFEAKGRVTSQTAAEEERNLHYLSNNPHIRINDCEVNYEVADEGERFQVLQHAYVYDFETVVLAISDSQSTLIRSVIIDYTTELKNHFGEVLKVLKTLSLDWAYSTTNEDDNSNNNRSNHSTNRTSKIIKIPEHIFEIAKDIKTINGRQTLQGTANLWFTLTRLPKPFPSFLRLIPAIYAFWNAVKKGGSDTTTKLMDDCIIRVPKPHLNAETVAVTRLISILLVLVHRLNQVFTANKDHSIYPSLYHYRVAASRRATFHVSILKCKKIFEQELKVIKNKENVPPPSSPTNRPTNLNRRNPIRRRVDGVLPERVESGTVLNFKTPKKITKLTANGNASQEISRMIDNCTGMIMKSYPVKYHRCNLCSKQTPWYCAGCKRWLCLDRKALQGNQKELSLYCHTVGGKEIQFSQNCFHKAHELAWKRKKID